MSFKIKSDDGSRSTSFTLSAQTALGYFGLSGSVVSQNSLDRSYEFYFDQFDGSTFQFINCGPASTTMAIKWADSTFMGRPVDARNLYLANGGWWNTGQIQAYLNINGINSAVDTLDDVVNVVKTNIDHNNLLILNLDMNYILLNSNFTQHVSKFYPTTPDWGHFILVKGYKQVGSTFYLDVYDPYSGGNKYSSILDIGQLMGKDRYYLSDDIKVATNNWWPYAIAIAPKGKKVNIATIIRANNLKLVPKSFGR